MLYIDFKNKTRKSQKDQGLRSVIFIIKKYKIFYVHFIYYKIMNKKN